MRTSKYTTLLLVFIVIILLFGVGIAIYYVLDLDWFSKKQLEIYKEINLYNENAVQIKKEIEYDFTKRTYNIKLSTENLDLTVYKDGTVGITLTEGSGTDQIEIYKENLNKEIKTGLTNIIRAYEVVASKTDKPNEYIVLLDIDGNLYKQEKKTLITTGDITFTKIQGLAQIIDVRQITKDELTEDSNSINCIAIDKESNELLLTDYLLEVN